MKRWMIPIMITLICCPWSALAQEEPADQEGSILERIRKVAEVITRSEEAREAGVPEEDVKVILEETRKRQLPPEETEEILAETAAAVEESGPVDNFGAYVQQCLDEGLRGQELAAAIHEEHRRNGKGKGHGKKEKKDKGKGHGHSHGKVHPQDGEHAEHSDGGEHPDGGEHDGHDHEDHKDHDDGDKEDGGKGKGHGKKDKGES